MPRKFKPIPEQKFPREQKILNGTNCLAFALGIKKIRRKKGKYSLEKTEEPIEITFLKKVKELGFNPRDFKKISSKEEEETPGYIIRVYGFKEKRTRDNKTIYDFHVIRREPNGKWVHKPGFFYPPKKLENMDWYAINLIYGNKYVSFAVKSKKGRN